MLRVKLRRVKEKMKEYNHKEIESKWQRKWAEEGIYKTEANSSKPKQYILDMFPYPSGEGLHVGHPRGYIATDVYSRMKRMQGNNILHSMGWDAFGLPAENFAIANKVHPRVAVEKNVTRFKEQLSLIGFDYDWSHEINTTDPKFYKWTQWIFLQMFKKGLAYESNEPINWCPSCQTGLANEDVNNEGECERCGNKVEKKPVRQWVLKITDYADRMLADLDKLPKWPEGVKEAQRNWIGKSEGAEIDFPMPNQPEHPIKIFTTRPDTIFGATYIAISAGLASKWMGMGWKAPEEVKEYIEKTLKEEAVRDFKEKEKTGIYAGFDAINPATKESIPVWITNYVMSDVGTGAIMAVPAHDERDFEFAKKYDLPIKVVVIPNHEEIRGVGALLKAKDGEYFFQVRDVDPLDPESNQIATFGGGRENNEKVLECLKREMFEELELDISKYKIKFASVYINEKDGKHVFYEIEGVEESELVLHEGQGIIKMSLEKAIVHPDLSEKQKKVIKQFLKSDEVCFVDYGYVVNSGEFDGLTTDEAKKKITEFVGGKMVSTYKIKDWIFSRQRYWGEPIPLIHCEKCGVVAVPEKDLPVLLPEVENYEPAGTGESPLANITEWVNVKCPECSGDGKRETNTMPQWAGSSWYYLRYIDPDNSDALVDKKKEKEWMPVDVYVGGDHATRHLIYARFWHKFLFDISAVTTEEPFPRLEFLGFILAEDGRKMSKRWKNVVNPDEMVERFGADSFRLYEMFIGPFESTVPWSTDGLVGTSRFLEKVWRLSYKVESSKVIKYNENLIHKTIKKIGKDIEDFKFNTAISAMMILVNEWEKTESILKEDYKKLLQILAPFAPHMTEEIWRELGETKSIHISAWPKYDESKIIDDEFELVVQVNGKKRNSIMVKNETSEEDIKRLSLEDESVKRNIEGKEILKVVVVPKRLINIVVK